MRPSNYYDSAREDIAALVPPTASRILDVGCGAGMLGRLLKQRQDCAVTGIELNTEQAEKARQALDQVYCGDAGEIIPLLTGCFDCIILADVLEHLRDPWRVLAVIKELLTPDGLLILSIPNIGHWSVVRDLIEGHWSYNGSGLLDRDHLRFFTRASLEAALREAGFTPALSGAHRVGEPVPGSVLEGVSQAGMDAEALAREGQAYQYLYIAYPPYTEQPLTSIIIVAHDLWDVTWTCLQSIRECTPEPHEVIMVDNGSTDETPDRLRELDWVQVVTNSENLPFAAANNRGLQIAQGDYIVLLNNDTVVTDGWLGRMLSILSSQPRVGIVGPMSNYVAGLQKVESASYETLDEMREFAAQWARDHAGETIPVAGVIGFCLLARRDVFDDVGLLDERFINGYEETDFCYRVLQAGWEIRVARDVFIHHSGSQTFKEIGADPSEHDSQYWLSIEENWQRFREKWDIPDGASADQGLAWLTRRLYETSAGPRVFWAVLYERSIMFESTEELLDIAAAAGKLGYRRLSVPYTATDNARNHLTRAFLTLSQHPDDVLVMLDCDHVHPTDVIQRLAVHPVGVVAALAFRRGPPHDPQFYVRDGDGVLQQPAEIGELGEVLAEGDLVGTGAIAIKRWVLDELADYGFEWPWFRYEYPEGSLNRPGEEIYFASICEEAGIRHYCDVSLESPHLATTLIGRRTWESYVKKHPEIVQDLEQDFEMEVSR